MRFRFLLLLGLFVVGLMLPVLSLAQEAEPRPDSSKTWHDDAWTRIVEQDGVRIDYIYYPEADNEHDGIVLRLINARDVAMGYAFTVVFRALEAETTAVVRGRLSPGQMKTGDDSGLFWVPFRGEDRSLAEIGLRGLEVWPIRNSRSTGPGPT